MTVHTSNQIVAHIRFKGGATQTITLALPPPFAQSRLTAPETLAAMDRLLHEYTDAPGALSSEICRAIVLSMGSSFKASMSINCVGITAFQVGMPAYERRGCSLQKNWRETQASPLKSCGEDIIREALLGCGTMIVDRVSFLRHRRINNC